jgi:hypothetical protein
MTREEHVFRRIRADSNSPDFSVLSQRELRETPYKLVFISVLYPLAQIFVYATTANTEALVHALLSMTIWVVTMFIIVLILRTSTKNTYSEDDRINDPIAV